jgi:hypothetical protein
MFVISNSREIHGIHGSSTGSVDFLQSVAVRVILISIRKKILKKIRKESNQSSEKSKATP